MRLGLSRDELNSDGNLYMHSLYTYQPSGDLSSEKASSKSYEPTDQGSHQGVLKCDCHPVEFEEG
jgi:hypothetical protein